MTPKDEALRIMHEAIRPPTEIQEVSLTDSLGRVLARDVTSDIDMPPFNRSAMDGYAVRAADCADASADLEVLEVIRAGTVPTRDVGPGQASRGMIGARCQMTLAAQLWPASIAAPKAPTVR